MGKWWEVKARGAFVVADSKGYPLFWTDAAEEASAATREPIDGHTWWRTEDHHLMGHRHWKYAAPPEHKKLRHVLFAEYQTTDRFVSEVA